MPLESELYGIEEGFWLAGKDHFLEHLDEQCLLVFPQVGEIHGPRSREEVAATASTPGRWRDLEMANRHLALVTDEVAIITYHVQVTRFDGEPYSALIGSAYARRRQGWKLVFHQHSPVQT